MTEEIIRKTTSICPECLQPIPAEIYVDPELNWVMMRKECKEHGKFKDKLSCDPEEYKWQQSYTDLVNSTINISTKPCEVSSGIKEKKNGCPYDCGICENHQSAPCICLIDVTNRCNLACPICFANASAKGYVVEPTFEQVVQIMEHFRSMKPQPAVLLQFAGGEPSLRDDLPDIIRKGKELGFVEAMISTNGIRMAKSIDLCREYKEAGLDAVYLQFDATDHPEVWKKVRGVNLWPIKKKVIENCRKVNNEDGPGHLTVMLVPVIARGVNDHLVGEIMDFAKDNNDVVGGVVFQPVSLCGRINFEELMELRYTTSDLKKDINKYTNNCIKKFYPLALTAKLTKLLAWFDDVPGWSPVSHQDCGFATIAVINDKGEYEPIEDYFEVEGFIKWANKVWDMVSEQKVPKPTSLLGGKINFEDYGSVVSTIAKFIDDMTNLGYRQMMKAYFFAGAMRYIKPKALASKTFRAFSKLVFAPNLTNAGNFFLSKNMLVSAMHFQDAYNFDLQRVRQCLVHYGVIDPDDPSKVLEIPFCAMNTVHREKLEERLAIPGAKTESPLEITKKIENYIESIQK
ncbi:MAG: radical SAM protein [Promethearchaeia archaeon]